MTPIEALAAAWTYCAPQRSKDVDFPRGFWPDVARVAIAMHEQQSINPVLDFRPTQCTVGNYPESAQSSTKRSSGKISSADRAANTARLLAMLSTNGSSQKQPSED